MTAVPDPDRDQLAKVLAKHQPVQRWVNYQWEGWGCSCGDLAADFRQHLAAALLPTVDAIAAERARQRAAEELEAAADRALAPDGWVSGNASLVWSMIRDRAAALRDAR